MCGSVCVLQEDEEEEEPLPELNDEQEEQVDQALGGGKSGAVLVTAFNIDITRADMSTLSGSGWLNDQVRMSCVLVQ